MKHTAKASGVILSPDKEAQKLADADDRAKTMTAEMKTTKMNEEIWKRMAFHRVENEWYHHHQSSEEIWTTSSCCTRLRIPRRCAMVALPLPRPVNLLLTIEMITGRDRTAENFLRCG